MGVFLQRVVVVFLENHRASLRMRDAGDCGDITHKDALHGGHPTVAIHCMNENVTRKSNSLH
ncbi:hypothetical protein [Dyella sp.]|uniref:hypothetical protein n=1 Tax=Dyella sp. TaxID=1869338 RepID=UPI002ED289B6